MARTAISVVVPISETDIECLIRTIENAVAHAVSAEDASTDSVREKAVEEAQLAYETAENLLVETSAITGPDKDLVQSVLQLLARWADRHVRR
jgi:hypothetical protein